MLINIYDSLLENGLWSTVIHLSANEWGVLFFMLFLFVLILGIFGDR